MVEGGLLSEIIREFRFCDSQELIFFNKFIENRNSYLETRKSFIIENTSIDTTNIKPSNTTNTTTSHLLKTVNDKQNHEVCFDSFPCDSRIDLWDWMLPDDTSSSIDNSDSIKNGGDGNNGDYCDEEQDDEDGSVDMVTEYEKSKEVSILLYKELMRTLGQDRQQVKRVS